MSKSPFQVLTANIGRSHHEQEKERLQMGSTKMTGKTIDFEISNVSEQSGSKNLITGEITNNYSEDVDQVNLSVVLRKESKIVYIDHTFIDHLKVGKAKAFQVSSYRGWPEHDTIDVSAMVW